MRRPPAPGASRDPDERHRSRGSIGVTRLLVALIVLGVLVLAGAHVAPDLAGVVSDRTAPPPDGLSPESLDRDETDGSSYDDHGGERIDAAAVEAGVHERVNDRRTAEGLDPIAWDETVADVARAHSVDMADRGYFAHETPAGDGPLDRFQMEADYCRGYGENIAMTWVGTEVRQPDGSGVDRYDSTDELVEGLVEQWLASPPHREAMFEPAWDRGGVGVYVTDDGQVFATHNFCLEW